MDMPNTKLLAPAVDPRTFFRKRLFKRLEPGLCRKLTLIKAGAGWGKTTLLASFFRFSGVRHAWFSMDPYDRDPLPFLGHLIQGLGSALPGTLKKSAGLFHRSDDGEALIWQDVAAVLINEMFDSLKIRFCMVFDDAHHFRDNPGLRGVLNHLLNHGPPNFHIFMATRDDPGLDTARLRVRDELVELNAGDLGFDPEEIQGLYQAVSGMTLDPEGADHLWHTTGGWAIALRMIAGTVYPEGLRTAEAAMADPGGQARVFDYFREEVFTPLPDALKDVITQTSVLNRFNADLCDAVLKTTGSAGVLKVLADSGLFIIRMAGSGGWYRTHHLFKGFFEDLLAAEISPDEIRELHERAATWHDGLGNWEETLFHTVAAQNFDRAVALITEKTGSLIRTASAEVVLYWTGQLPENLREAHAAILFARGWALILTGRWNEARRLLTRAKTQALGARSLPLAGMIFYFLMALCYFQMAYGDIPVLAEEAAVHFPPQDPCLPELKVMVATAQMYLNRPDRARAVWDEIRRHPAVRGDEALRLRLMTLKGPHYFFPLGQFDEALAQIEEGLAYYRHNDYMGRYAQYKAFLGFVRHDMGWIAESQALFQESVSTLKKTDTQIFMPALYSGLAINAVLLGQIEEARSLVDEAHGLLSRFDTRKLMRGHLLHIAPALLAFQDQDREGFFRHADAALAATDAVGEYWDHYTVACLVAPGYAGLGETWRARALLEQTLAQARTLGAAYGEARSRLLLAEVLAASGDHVGALDHLRGALERGETRPYECLFLHKERQAFLELLPLAVKEDLSPAYLKVLVSRMGEDAVVALVPLLACPDPSIRARTLDLMAGSDCRLVRGQIQALGDDPEATVRASARCAIDRSDALAPLPLKAFFLGRFRLFQGGREVPVERWERKKALSIVKYLLFHPGRKVHTEVLMETFYGDLPAKSAYETLRKTMSSIRSGLEPGLLPRKKSAYLRAGKGVYELRLPQGSQVDAVVFEDLARRAEKARQAGDPDLALAHCRAAAELWRGGFLEDDPYEPWTDAAREHYRALYLRVLHAMACRYFVSLDHDHCLGVVEKILCMDELDEPACLLSMKCHLARGDRAKAVAAFRRCEKALHRDLGIPPGKALADLFQYITCR